MMKTGILYFLGLILLFAACNQSTKPATDEESLAANSKDFFYGEWTAQWITDPESYPDTLTVASYSMDGKWVFNKDETMSIAAYGFKGCIFGEDTIVNSQNWLVSNDTIMMLNDQKIASLTCKIVSMSQQAVKLQLLPDIYVNLTRE